MSNPKTKPGRPEDEPADGRTDPDESGNTAGPDLGAGESSGAKRNGNTTPSTAGGPSHKVRTAIDVNATPEIVPPKSPVDDAAKNEVPKKGRKKRRQA